MIYRTGYLDYLFFHHNYQKQAIARAICDQLEEVIQGDITTYASITAKPFFEKRGYIVVKEQQIERQDIFLTSFYMKLVNCKINKISSPSFCPKN